MSKKLIKLFIFSLTLGIIIFLIYNIINKSKEIEIIEKKIKSIPEFSFNTLEKTKYTKNDLTPYLPTIFLYFNSECDMCHFEAQNISENIGRLESIQLIFISTESIKKIKVFSEQHNLNSKQNITFLSDNDNSFSTLFNVTSIPSSIIYDKQQNLIKIHKGQINQQGILNSLTSKNY
ncbi:peroxiredoxin [Tenacibaculum singaporense]|nr:redoxin domain-containing protein [Tenacibaculum singaporense]